MKKQTWLVILSVVVLQGVITETDAKSIEAALQASTEQGQEAARLPHERLTFTRGDSAYTIRADGKDERLVIKFHRGAHWSPDGQRLLYWSVRAELFSVDARDADAIPAPLGSQQDGYSSPICSPDGTRIAFISRYPDESLYVVDREGGHKKLLSAKCGTSSVPAWSRDSKRILYMAHAPGSERGLYLYTLDPAGDTNECIVRADYTNLDPAWAPSGNSILYTRVTNHQFRLCVANWDGSGERMLIPEEETAHDATWSPDGKWIAYYSNLTKSPDNWHLALIGPESMDRTEIAKVVPGGGFKAAWSKDSKWIAFQTGASGKEAIYIVRADGTGLRKIVGDGATLPQWQPPLVDNPADMGAPQ